MEPKLVNMLQKTFADTHALLPGHIGSQGRIRPRLRLFGNYSISHSEKDTLNTTMRVDNALVVAWMPILVNAEFD